MLFFSCPGKNARIRVVIFRLDANEGLYSSASIFGRSFMQTYEPWSCLISINSYGTTATHFGAPTTICTLVNRLHLDSRNGKKNGISLGFSRRGENILSH